MANQSCNSVHSYTNQCEFVRNNSNCQDYSGYINYVEVLYCNFGGDAGSRSGALILFVTWLGVLFIGLGKAADDYLCPNLAVVSKKLRLSQNIAGITILAFGNGAPDIFSSLAGVGSNRPELVFGALFGAGMFVTTVVAGAICWLKPFDLMKRPFLRDITFYLIAVFWSFCIFFRQRITIYDSLGFLGLYITYIVVVVVGRAVNQRLRRRHDNQSDEQSVVDDDDDTIYEPDHTVEDVQSLQESEEEVVVHSSPTTLMTALNPLAAAGSLPWYWRIWAVINAPVVLVFNLTIPVVDEEKPDYGWCQAVVVIQSIIGTQVTAFFLGVSSIEIRTRGDLVLYGWELALVASLLFAIAILWSSQQPERGAPCYFGWCFSFLGFVAAVVWMYVLANEAVDLLKAFGVVFGLSDVILGLTVLAWGNSIGDFISDTSVARSGMPRMGFSACFGGQLLNILLGIGISFTIQFAKNGFTDIPVVCDPMTITLCASLGLSLVVSLLMMPLSKFKAAKKQGVILMTLYLCLLVAAITVEFTNG